MKNPPFGGFFVSVGGQMASVLGLMEGIESEF